LKYFIVFQNKSFRQEHEGGFLWAPIEGSSGQKALFHWESMLQCQPNDVVFSVINNRIVARSIILNPAIKSVNPFDASPWGKQGWLVKVNYEFSINQIKISDYISQIKDMLPDKYSPINKKTGRGNMGYLFPINRDLGEYLDSLIISTFSKIDPSMIFSVSEEDAEIINEVFTESGLTEGEVVLIEEEPPRASNKPKTKVSRVYANKTDFIEKSKSDVKKGIKAERLVVEYEKSYLMQIGREDLAEKVKWVAQEADGYGYDVLSFDESGNEKFIEVKGTSLMKTAPFQISKNEIDTSIKKGDQYWLYRVFYIDEKEPKFYRYRGRIDKNFELEPSNFNVYTKESE
jgi:hypothetical protein